MDTMKVLFVYTYAYLNNMMIPCNYYGTLLSIMLSLSGICLPDHKQETQLEPSYIGDSVFGPGDIDNDNANDSTQGEYDMDPAKQLYSKKAVPVQKLATFVSVYQI